MPVHRVVGLTKKQIDELEAAKEQLAAGAGRALAEWSLVELMLTFLFASIISRSTKPFAEGVTNWESDEPQRRLAQAMLNAVVGFEVRIDLVTATVAESDLRKDLKRLWPEIAKRLKKLYKNRHEAAHFIFDRISYPDGKIEVLLAPFPKTVLTLDDKRLTRKQLDHKAERYREIGIALRWFMDAVEIQRRRAKGPRAPEPELIQRARQSLRNQNLSERG